MIGCPGTGDAAVTAAAGAIDATAEASAARRANKRRGLGRAFRLCGCREAYCFGGVPDEVLLQSFANTVTVFSRDGVVTPASVEKAGRFMVESGTVKRAATFADVADNGFLPKP